MCNQAHRHSGAMRLTIGLLFLSASLSAQAGWQTIKDKTGACQLSVPDN